jgi:hypothetical protein
LVSARRLSVIAECTKPSVFSPRRSYDAAKIPDDRLKYQTVGPCTPRTIAPAVVWSAQVRAAFHDFARDRAQPSRSEIRGQQNKRRSLFEANRSECLQSCSLINAGSIRRTTQNLKSLEASYIKRRNAPTDKTHLWDSAANRLLHPRFRHPLLFALIRSDVICPPVTFLFPPRGPSSFWPPRAFTPAQPHWPGLLMH